MSRLSNLKSFMGRHGVSQAVLEMTLGITPDAITEDTAAEIQTRLTELVKHEFSEDAFAAVCRAHGVDEETIAMLAQIESAPSVLEMFLN